MLNNRFDGNKTRSEKRQGSVLRLEEEPRTGDSQPAEEGREVRIAEAERLRDRTRRNKPRRSLGEEARRLETFIA